MEFLTVCSQTVRVGRQFSDEVRVTSGVPQGSILGHYTVQKAWRALHFIMHIVNRGNKNTKSLAYMSLVCPILKYGAACQDSYGECQISVLDRMQNKAAKFAHVSEGSDWESLTHRRKVTQMRALYIAYNGERAWKDIGDRLQVSHYPNRDDSHWKIRAREQRTDGKFSFVNRTIVDWNQLPEGVTGFSPAKIHIFSKRVRKGITVEGKESEVNCCEAYIWKLFLSKLCVTVFFFCGCSCFVLCTSRCCLFSICCLVYVLYLSSVHLYINTATSISPFAANKSISINHLEII
jgi:hypothetical protein